MKFKGRKFNRPHKRRYNDTIPDAEPEDATPWENLRAGILDTEKIESEKKEQESFLKKREENSRKFQIEEGKKRTKEWDSFSDHENVEQKNTEEELPFGNELNKFDEQVQEPEPEPEPQWQDANEKESRERSSFRKETRVTESIEPPERKQAKLNKVEKSKKTVPKRVKNIDTFTAPDEAETEVDPNLSVRRIGKEKLHESNPRKIREDRFKQKKMGFGGKGTSDRPFREDNVVRCLGCRGVGHFVKNCPEIQTTKNICLKCGAGDHQYQNCTVVKTLSFNFATCFVCKEKGHIAKQCVQNTKGIYPNGGHCNACGAVSHLERDCPRKRRRKIVKKPYMNTGGGGHRKK